MTRGRVPALLLVLGTLLLYLPAAGFGFLNWDDGLNILENPHARGFSTTSLKWWWTAFHGGHYMPLTWMSYAVDFSLWGLKPGGYHATNVALHALNALLVWMFFRRVLSLSQKEVPWAGAAAALAAAWWAWHPARVESVAWVSQRRDLLASALLLGAANLHVRRRSAEAFGFFSASLFAKAVGGVFPAVLLAVDRTVLRRSEPWPRLLREKASWFLLGAAVLGTAAVAQAQAGAAVSLGTFSLLQRIAQAGFGAADYALRTFLPLTPRLVHEFPKPFHAGSLLYMAPLAAAAAAAILLFRHRRRFPGAAAAGAAFVLFLSPTLGFLQSGPQFTASRYTYLASVAPAALVAAGLSRRRWAWAAVFLWTAAGALQTARRLPAWRDGETFWRAVVAESPGSALAWSNLGEELLRQERMDEALAAFDECLRHGPSSPQDRPMIDAETSRGYIFLRRGRLEESVAASRRALRADPSSPEAANNLGLALLGQGKTGEALTTLSALASSRPDFAEGRSNLGFTLIRAGRAAEAEREFRAAAALGPGSAAVRYNLALLLSGLGRPEEALAEWRAAAALDPSLPPLPDGRKNGIIK